jgi:hypothetical protein
VTHNGKGFAAIWATIPISMLGFVRHASDIPVKAICKIISVAGLPKLDEFVGMPAKRIPCFRWPSAFLLHCIAGGLLASDADGPSCYMHITRDFIFGEKLFVISPAAAGAGTVGHEMLILYCGKIRPFRV